MHWLRVSGGRSVLTKTPWTLAFAEVRPGAALSQVRMVFATATYIASLLGDVARQVASEVQSGGSLPEEELLCRSRVLRLAGKKGNGSGSSVAGAKFLMSAAASSSIHCVLVGLGSSMALPGWAGYHSL